MIVVLRAPSLAKFGEVDTVPGVRNVTTQEWLDIDSYYMYGDQRRRNELKVGGLNIRAPTARAL